MRGSVWARQLSLGVRWYFHMPRFHYFGSLANPHRSHPPCTHFPKRHHCVARGNHHFACIRPRNSPCIFYKPLLGLPPRHTSPCEIGCARCCRWPALTPPTRRSRSSSEICDRKSSGNGPYCITKPAGLPFFSFLFFLWRFLPLSALTFSFA